MKINTQEVNKHKLVTETGKIVNKWNVMRTIENNSPDTRRKKDSHNSAYTNSASESNTQIEIW
jgi:hypothetical protein